MKILVDTSVWIEHFRKRHDELVSWLNSGSVLMHPCVTGELACGNLADRVSLLATLGELPRADTAAHDEVLLLIEAQHLWGRGLGWTDAQLLASALLSECRLITLDKRLAAMAEQLGVG